MARTILTAMTALGPYNPDAYAVASAADLTMAAADTGDGNAVVATDRQAVFAHNTNVGAQTVSVTSTNDPYGRRGHVVTYSIGAGEYAIFGPFKLLGWSQTNGQLYFNASHAEVKLGVINLPT